MEELFSIIEEHCMQAAPSTDAEEKFYHDIINPVCADNHKAGIELEGRFLLALDAVQSQSFKEGFKAGITFLLECIGNK